MWCNQPWNGNEERSVLCAAKLDVNDRTPFVAVAPDGLMCQARDAVQWGGIRGSVGISGGPGLIIRLPPSIRDLAPPLVQANTILSAR
jgi:hypothetical protein